MDRDIAWTLSIQGFIDTAYARRVATRLAAGPLLAVRFADPARPRGPFDEFFVRDCAPAEALAALAAARPLPEHYVTVLEDRPDLVPAYARGGYQLARRADSISAAAILDALEGPLALTECASSPGQCDIEGHCRVSRAWQSVSGAIRRSLQDVTLAQLAGLENEPVHLPILEREVKIIGTRTRGAS